MSGTALVERLEKELSDVATRLRCPFEAILSDSESKQQDFASQHGLHREEAANEIDNIIRKYLRKGRDDNLYSLLSKNVAKSQENAYRLPNPTRSYGGRIGQSCGDFFYTFSRRGCGTFQCLLFLTLVSLLFGLIFLLNITEIRLAMNTFTRWKELHVQQIETVMDAKKHANDVKHKLNIDLDKMKEEHEHMERMALIQLADNAMKRFIESNTYKSHSWGVRPLSLGTENSETTRTLFSEEDLIYFRNEILGYVTTTLNNAVAEGSVEGAPFPNPMLGAEQSMPQCPGSPDDTRANQSQSVPQHDTGEDSFDSL